MTEKRKFRIALIAPFDEEVPPKKYGGTELVVSNIAECLSGLGYEIFLLASGDSRTSGHLVKIFEKAMRQDLRTGDSAMRNVMKIIGTAKVVDALRRIEVDVIHNHLGWRFLPFAESFGAPTVTTLHGPLDPAYQKFAYGKFPKQNYVSISDSQREPLPGLNYVKTVYNGIDLSLFEFSPKTGDYLVFLGRMSPEKGPVQAIKIARKFGMKLVMAAKVDEADRDFFEREVAPEIDGKRTEYIGEIGHREKSEFLKNAYALLAPIQWREPFGLFMAEASACGTPVVVTNAGSAPEIIEDGKTGFLSENSEESFVDALEKIPSIKRENCRKRAEEKFSKEKMALEYLGIYEKITGRNLRQGDA